MEKPPERTEPRYLPDDMSSLTPSEDSKAEDLVEEVEEEEDYIERPKYSEEELEKLVFYIRQMTTLFNLREEDWNVQVLSMIRDWLIEVTELMLLVFFDGVILTAAYTFPLVPVANMCYFLRRIPNHIFTVDGFHDEVAFGSVHGDVEGTLLHVFESIYTPAFSDTDEWASNIKGHLQTEIHIFMSYLTDIHYKMSGITKLYIPYEGMKRDVIECAKDKYLVKRLEAIVVFWTKQIRLCLNDVDQLMPYEIVCPADEYNFWIYKYEILNSLALQFENDNVKHIMAILNKIQSLFIKQLGELIQDIQVRSDKTKDNFLYLQLLLEPCMRLESLTVSSPLSDFTGQITHIMHLIHIIWVHSKYYNQRENVNKLLTYFSNEVIICCTQKIDLIRILSGFPRYGIKVCDTFIIWCMTYKVLLKKLFKYYEENTTTGMPEVDELAVFNQVDAFIQRLQDIIEICESMIAFRKDDEESNPSPFKPRFTCNNYLELEQMFKQVESLFEKGMESICNAIDVILNLHDKNWQRIKLNFKMLIKNIEEIVENSITSVFLNVENIEEMLEALTSITKFATNRRISVTFMKKVSDMWALLQDEINEVSKYQSERRKERYAYAYTYSGKIIPLVIRYKKLERLRKLINDATYLPLCAASGSINSTYETNYKLFDKTVRNYSEDWIETWQKQPRFTNTLMAFSITYPGLLECNMDEDLRMLVDDSKLLEMLGVLQVGHAAKYRSMKMSYKNVVKVVLDYNSISSSLSVKEMMLFRDLIAGIEQKVRPGIHRLTWAEEVGDLYIGECVKHTGELQLFIAFYKRICLEIVRFCERICGINVLEFRTRQPVELVEMRSMVQATAESCRYEIYEIFRTIINFTVLLFERFSSKSHKVSKPWLEFVTRIDKLLQESILTCIRSSMDKFLLLLTGSGSFRSDPIVKFSVNLTGNQIIFEPPLQQMEQFIHNLLENVAQLFTVIFSIVQRYEQTRSGGGSAMASIITEDRHCRRINKSISEVIQTTREHLNRYLELWKPYRVFIEVRKEVFVSDLSETDPKAEKIEENLLNYDEVLDDLIAKDHENQVQFLLLNSAHLKRSLAKIINDWKRLHAELLKKLAYDKLLEFYEYTGQSLKSISKDPENLDELQAVLATYARLTTEVEPREAEFRHVRKYFDAIDRYEVQISPSIKRLAVNWNEHWRNYVSRLEKRGEQLEYVREIFRSNLVGRLAGFRQTIQKILDNFDKLAPTSSKWATIQALIAIRALEEELNNLKVEEKEILDDLVVFKIYQDPSIDLVTLSQDVQIISKCWRFILEWESLWKLTLKENVWKILKEKMEKNLVKFSEKFSTSLELLENRKWNILNPTALQIDQMNRSLVLIYKLEDPAIRERHWDEIRALTKKEFDPSSEDFNLKAFLSIGFLDCEDELNDIYLEALEEQKIEERLNVVHEEFKKIRLIQTTIDGNRYLIGKFSETMDFLQRCDAEMKSIKGTKFTGPFETLIDNLEINICFCMEGLESLEKLQEQFWILKALVEDYPGYFKGIPDWIKGLDDFSKELSRFLKSLKGKSNIFESFSGQTPHKLLSDVNDHFRICESLESQLKDFLNSRRAHFPRLFYLSDKDLLQLLGSKKEPQKCIPLLPQLYSNINRILMDQSNPIKALGVSSRDNEQLTFTKPIPMKPTIDYWLLSIDKSSKKTLQGQIVRRLPALIESPKDGWHGLIHDSCCSQISLLLSQLYFTLDCTKHFRLCTLLAAGSPLNPREPLNRLICVIRQNQKTISNLAQQQDLTCGERRKVENLLVWQIYARDRCQQFYEQECYGESHFEWFRTLRFEWNRESNNCWIRIGNAELRYGWEFEGKVDSIFLTPDTIRCFLSITFALKMHRGVLFQGPTASGKSEIMRSLVQMAGIWFKVFALNESTELPCVENFLKAIALNGHWACFTDIFKLDSRLVSLLVEKAQKLYQALEKNEPIFTSNAINLFVEPNFGIFIHQNTDQNAELLTNLKPTFRVVAIIEPDVEVILQSRLTLMHFGEPRKCAKLIVWIWERIKRYFGQEGSYDFSFSFLKKILKILEALKQKEIEKFEENILAKAFLEVTSKILKKCDFKFFKITFSRIFPFECESKTNENILEGAIISKMIEMGLDSDSYLVQKCLEINDLLTKKYPVVLLGPEESGKSTALQVLREIQSDLKIEVKVFRINPNVYSAEELFGTFAECKLIQNSIISKIFENSETHNQVWIIFDGSIDPKWTDGLNSLLDKTQSRVFENGKNLRVPDNLNFIFETTDVSYSSPSFLARCSIVHFESNPEVWKLHINSWLKQQPDKVKEMLGDLINEYFGPILVFRKQHCSNTFSPTDLHMVQNFTRLWTCLGTKKNGVAPLKPYFTDMTKSWFFFCVTWSLCSTTRTEHQTLLDNFFRPLAGVYPLKGTIYDFYVDIEDKCLKSWKEHPQHLQSNFVVTSENVRYIYLLQNLLDKSPNVTPLVVGEAGVGKTSLIEYVFRNSNKMMFETALSTQMSSNTFERTILSSMEKKTKSIQMPLERQKCLFLIDDLNQAAASTLDLVQQILDLGILYNRETGLEYSLEKVQFVGAMRTPNGARWTPNKRLLSRFHLIEMAPSSGEGIVGIFTDLLSRSEVNEDLGKILLKLGQANWDFLQLIRKKLKPIPTRFYTEFNLKHAFHVLKTLILNLSQKHDTKEKICRLWIHECFRIFWDRLSDKKDQQTFLEDLNLSIGENLDTTITALCPSESYPLFVKLYDFYEDQKDFEGLRTEFQKHLERYNLLLETKHRWILHEQMVVQIARILRVLDSPNGLALLMGETGVGRETICRLASFIRRMNFVALNSDRKGYRMDDFRNDLMLFYAKLIENEHGAVFFVRDCLLPDEECLGVLNEVISTGWCASIFKDNDVKKLKERLHLTGDFWKTITNRFRSHGRVIVSVDSTDRLKFIFRIYKALSSQAYVSIVQNWTEDSLIYVARILLADIKLDETITEKREIRRESLILKSADRLRNSLSQVLSSIHDSAMRKAENVGGNLFVSSSNFIDLISTYIRLLSSKRQEIAEKVFKLRLGLQKIAEAKESVVKLSTQLAENSTKIEEFQVTIDRNIAEIESKSRETNEAKLEIEEQKIVTTKERIVCAEIAQQATRDLEKVRPLFDEALAALDTLNPKDLSELKTYTTPPVKIGLIMEAVMILLRVPPTWVEAKRQLGEQNFLEVLKNYDKNNISDRILRKIGKYAHDPELEPEKVRKTSEAIASLAKWIRAMEKYGKVWKIVGPKQQRKEEALSSLKEKEDQLRAAEARLEYLNAYLVRLKKEHENKLRTKEKLEVEAERLRKKLNYARLLVDALGSENTRWKESIDNLEDAFDKLLGNCLLIAAFITYCGLMDENLRQEMLEDWTSELEMNGIPIEVPFNPSKFLLKTSKIQEWQHEGLPQDEFSLENGIICQESAWWNLVIDPENQLDDWLVALNKPSTIKIIDYQHAKFAKKVQNAISKGKVLIIRKVPDEIDCCLLPVLRRTLIHKVDGVFIKFCGKIVRYSEDFRLFLVSNKDNPKFKPIILNHVNVINFMVKRESLESRLLVLVIKKENPAIEEKKDTLDRQTEESMQSLEAIEEKILKTLNEIKGSVIDREDLLEILESSKKTAEEIKSALQESEVTRQNILKSREQYRPVAIRAASLYLSLIPFFPLENMYKISLKAYISIFLRSLERAAKSPRLDDRIRSIIDTHTFNVFQFGCSSFFACHRLLFGFQMCLSILEADDKLNTNDLALLVDEEVGAEQDQLENPSPDWIMPESWNLLLRLNRLPGYKGIVDSFVDENAAWESWYLKLRPEQEPLIQDWERNLTSFQRILLIKCFRPDRIEAAVRKFIGDFMGERFIKAKPLKIADIFRSSRHDQPILFVLAPNADVTPQMQGFVLARKMQRRFNSILLGEGQEDGATKAIRKAQVDGHWVYLRNGHLSIEWLPEVMRLLTPKDRYVSNNFRMWLSSDSHPQFPESLLMVNTKLTVETPNGIKENLAYIYSALTEEQLKIGRGKEGFKRVLFAAAFLQALIAERARYGQLGWNKMVTFTIDEFEAIRSTIKEFFLKFPDPPWDFITYFISDLTFLAAIFDKEDKKLLRVYFEEIFQEELLTEFNFHLTKSIIVPFDGSLQTYKDFIDLLEDNYGPECIGLGENAQQLISRKISEDFLVTLRIITPAFKPTKVLTKKHSPVEIIQSILIRLPLEIDLENALKILEPNTKIMDLVLLEEIAVLNRLLAEMKTKLVVLRLCLLGEYSLDDENERVLRLILANKVPEVWRIYPSKKPLYTWLKDLSERVKFFAKWSETGHMPAITWLGGFTRPFRFLEANLQVAAQKQETTIDQLTWDFKFEKEEVVRSIEEGEILIRGLFIDGARLNQKEQSLDECKPLRYIEKLPLLSLRPIKKDEISITNSIRIPCFYSPERKKHVFSIQLNAVLFDQGFWLKRKVAFLLNVDD